MFAGDSDLQCIVFVNCQPRNRRKIFEILTSKWVLAKSLGGRMFGFINRIVHKYEKTDMKIVHTVRKKNSADIVGFCRAVVLKLSL